MASLKCYIMNEVGPFSHQIISKRSIWSGLQAAEAKTSYRTKDMYMYEQCIKKQFFNVFLKLFFSNGGHLTGGGGGAIGTEGNWSGG